MLTNLIEDLKFNRITLRAYINEYCDLIDAQEPIIKALLPEADRRLRLIKEAEELEKRFPNPETRPPLYGVLVGIKDIIRVDGFPTKAGSQLPDYLFEGSEAESVKLLREAGALILGKTVTTEFAYFEPGPTVNPCNTEHTPGGSSSGSAAAVAAGFCSFALGTQTIGSVIRPGAFCGVVGFKPSFDRIATDGLIYFSKSVDHIGFFTKDVADVDVIASVLCPNWNVNDNLKSTKTVLGVPEGPYLNQMPAEGLAVFEAHLQRLSKEGYVIKRVPLFENILEINELHRHLVFSEFADEHEEWFNQYESLYRPHTKDAILKGRKVSGATVDKAKKVSTELRQHVHEVMAVHDIDLWICPPALGAAPKGIQSTGDPIMNLPWTNTGMPTLTFPVEKTEEGLPIGLQVVAPYMQDEQLVSWSKTLVKALYKNSAV